jgi:sugar phosphate isomerase/epimerase
MEYGRSSANWPRLTLGFLLALWGCHPAMTDAASDSAGRGGGAPLPNNLFGAYNFTIDTRTPEQQIDFLKGIGYAGIMIQWGGEAKQREWAQVPAVKSGSLRVVAALMGIDTNKPVDRPWWTSALKALAETKTVPWILVTGTKGQNKTMADRLAEVADLAKPLGVTVVIYPHQGLALEATEESVEVLKLAKRDNLKTSLHICHEFKVGFKDRLAAVINATLPYVELVSINGTFEDGGTRGGWDRAIVPLAKGDFDVQNKFLLPLRQAGYSGPILLHTYGITDPPEQHFRLSFEKYRQMLLATDKVLTK